jgi:hypothetical protein
VWYTLITQPLLTVLQKKSSYKKSDFNVATLVRIHLVSMLEVYELLKNIGQTWVKAKANNVGLPSLFPK